MGEFRLPYETYHTRILCFDRYVRRLTYSILAYSYPRAMLRTIMLYFLDADNETVSSTSWNDLESQSKVTGDGTVY